MPNCRSVDSISRVGGLPAEPHPPERVNAAPVTGGRTPRRLATTIAVPAYRTGPQPAKIQKSFGICLLREADFSTAPHLCGAKKHQCGEKATCICNWPNR